MRAFLPFVLLASTLLVACGSDSDTGGVQTGPFRLLVYSQTDGFRHASIETGVETVRQLGLMHGFEVDHTEDPSAFTPDNLARYAVVMWLSTTGDLLDADQRSAFERYIAEGGGYAGVHSASDTNYDWPFYGELVGAYFHSHPIFPLATDEGPGVQSGELRVEAPDQPSVAHLPQPWILSDEFYSFRSNPRGRVRVLLDIDESSYNQDPNTTNISQGSILLGETAVMNDHPMSWCHDNLGGRAWYTALGHSVTLYGDGLFRQHLLNGILTAARRVEADCRPREDGPLAEPNTGPAIGFPGLIGDLIPLPGFP
jgi:type 1 glutamine amidotransferase